MPFQKGNKITLGRKHSEESKKKMSLAKLGDKHPKWKGDNVTYINLHNWLRRHLPKPDLCQICGKNWIIEIANITGIYTKDLDHYLYLCHSCHHIIDGLGHNFTRNRF